MQQFFLVRSLFTIYGASEEAVFTKLNSTSMVWVPNTSTLQIENSEVHASKALLPP